jgi:hypothetical protein
MKEGYKMIWAIAVMLVVLWALGIATAHTASGLIHLLLVIPVLVVLLRAILGRRAL